VRKDFMYYLPIRGFGGVLVSACLDRPMVMLVSDFAFFLYGRHPFEMGCVQWWSGRVWAWILLGVSTALRAQRSIIDGSEPTSATLPGNQSMEPPLRNATARSATAPWLAPLFLAALAATLFVLWLLSHLAFFLLCKREYWSSFCTPLTGAGHVDRRWGTLSDEKKATLLVRVHPALLRLIATRARLWMELNEEAWENDRPEWLTDRWLRAVPSSMLPKKIFLALGGKNRRRSTLTERLALMNDLAVPVPDPIRVGADAVSRTEPLEPELLAIVPTVESGKQFYGEQP
jgi:hypothetical protein